MKKRWYLFVFRPMTYSMNSLYIHSIFIHAICRFIQDFKRQHLSYKIYTVNDHGSRKVVYAEKKDILDGIIRKYQPELYVRFESEGDIIVGGQNQTNGTDNGNE